MKRALALAAIVALFLAAVSTLTLLSAPSSAASTRAATAPSVVWSTSNVSEIIKPGESKQVEVVLTAQSAIPAGALRVVPELAPFVSVSPSTTPALIERQTLPVSLTFSAKIDALPTTTTGTLQLRDDTNGATIAKPLQVGVKIAWPTARLNNTISVQYPATLILDSSAIPPMAGNPYLSLIPWNTTAQDGEHDLPDISIELVPNPAGLSFSEFYNGADDGTHSPFNFNELSGPINGTSTITVQGRNAIRVFSTDGYVAVVIPVDHSFLEVTDGGIAFQASGEFQRVLDGLVIGAQ